MNSLFLLQSKAEAMAVEEFNAEATDNERAMYGQEYNHDGTLVQVDTPWAMGVVNRQGALLSSPYTR